MRLEVINVPLKSRLAEKFQFQTGSIRSICSNTSTQYNISTFQFQTGSIRRKKDKNGKLLSPFQFQTGSIRRGIDTLDAHFLKWFQFQTGSIRRRSSNPVAVDLFRFNSKLVRLEESTQIGNGRIVEVSIPNWCD